MERIGSEEELLDFLERRGPFGLCIWDFDGVVCDSEPQQAESYRRLLARRGRTTSPEFFDRLVGLTEPEIWERILADQGVDWDRAGLVAERHEVLIPMLAAMPPNWWLRPTLAWLTERAVPSRLVSSGNRNVIEAYLEAHGLSAAFASVSVADHGARPKAERLGGTIDAAAPARVLVFEDSDSYLAVARDRGAVTVRVAHSLNAAGRVAADAVVTGDSDRALRGGRAGVATDSATGAQRDRRTAD